VILAASVGSALEVVRLLPLRHRRGAGVRDLFFPKSDPVVGTLLAFLTFGVASLVRPSVHPVRHHGRPVRRKPVLVATLLMIGIALPRSVCCRPMPRLATGAPALLVTLRVVQGWEPAPNMAAR